LFYMYLDFLVMEWNAHYHDKGKFLLVFVLVKLIQSTTFHLFLGLLSNLFLIIFPNKILYEFVSSVLFANWPAHFVPLI